MAAAAIEIIGGLDTAIAQQHLPQPSQQGSLTNPNDVDSQAYLWAINTRLRKLGVVGRITNVWHSTRRPNSGGNDPGRRINPLLERGIKRFQTLAGLKVDGWAGPKTWQLMECLLSFENDQDINVWQPHFGSLGVSLEQHPLVQRALFVRLQTMGFMPTRNAQQLRFIDDDSRLAVLTESERKNLIAGLAKFATFYNKVQTSDDSSLSVIAPALSKASLAAVFDFDSLVKTLGNKGSFARVNVKSNRRVLVALTTIELWLRGYDVRPGEEPYKIKKRVVVVGRKRTEKKTKVSSLRDVLKQYWFDLGRTDDKPEISSELFASFAINSLPEEADAEQAGAAIDDRITAVLKDKPTELEHQIKSLAGTIWDGMKRALHWLVRLFKKAVSVTKALVVNVARVVSRHARRGFDYFARALEAVRFGLTYRGTSVYCSETTPVFAVQRDTDLDHLVFLRQQATDCSLSKAVVKHGRDARIYQAGCAIVGYFFNIARKVLAIYTSVTTFSWLYALLALGRIYRTLQLIKTEVDTLKSIDQESIYAKPVAGMEV